MRSGPRGGAGDGGGLFALRSSGPPGSQDPRRSPGILGLAPWSRHGGKGRKKGRDRSHRPETASAPFSSRRLGPGSDTTQAPREFYNRILARCGVTQKAITALARKPAIVIRRLCFGTAALIVRRQ